MIVTPECYTIVLVLYRDSCGMHRRRISSHTQNIILRGGCRCSSRRVRPRQAADLHELVELPDEVALSRVLVCGEHGWGVSKGLLVGSAAGVGGVRKRVRGGPVTINCAGKRGDKGRLCAVSRIRVMRNVRR